MSLASSQHTDAVGSVTFSYTSGLRSVVNTSLKPNLLYNVSKVSDPGTIYRNITNNESILSEYVFSSNSAVGVTVYVSVALEVISGTSPEWQSTLDHFGYTVSFNGTRYVHWVKIPFSLNSTLSKIQSINRQLNITSGDPTIVFNASESEFIGNSIQLNHTSLELTVNYPSIYFSSFRNETWQYMQVGHDPNAWNNATSTVESVVPLKNDKSALQSISYGSFAIAAVISAILAAGIQNRKRSELESFIRKNRDNIIAVNVDPLLTKGGTLVNSIEELTKLSDLAGQPIFMHESDGKCILFAEYGSGIYYYAISARNDYRTRYRILRNN